MNNNYNVNFKEKALEYKEQMLEDQSETNE